MKTKKQQNLCVFRCGQPVDENSKRLCTYHLEHQRLKMAAYRIARKKKRLCSRCGNTARILPNGKASTLCEDCRAHVRKWEKKIRAREKRALKKQRSKKE